MAFCFALVTEEQILSADYSTCVVKKKRINHVTRHSGFLGNLQTNLHSYTVCSIKCAA